MTDAPDPSNAYLFAGGGTGGHIYPALAIIEQLQLLDPAAHCELLVSDRPNDRTILEPLDIPFAPLPAKPFGSRPKAMLRFIPSWGPSVRQTREAIRRLKRSHASVTLIAMGGFVAAPAARAGHCERCRVVLVNLDAVPGKANELIARKAHAIYTACDIKGHPTWTRVPPIVRASTIQRLDPSQARARFDLDPNTNTLLITGGSTGAQSLNRFLAAYVDQHAETLRGWQVIHQTGKQISDSELTELRAAYANAGIRAWVEHYIDDMGAAYAGAELGISRCGAGTVAECWGAKLPSMFFPYPYHKDQHQLHNAKPLIEIEGAIACRDEIDPQTNLRVYQDVLADLLTNPDRRARMREALASLGEPDGAARVAQALVKPA
ncbi:MAG: UDP-N-acetylglucosamine--N-acetylmuramyl-(pentapeptide) pyrophosphoryl-undecaprenol N-acetylglucosamine transferase [Phycisphaerales bacterium]|nr:UDP-N-acetylglucosamine--N-acetylmuramyl-(pentapeptide) pyrophosphoryl-undecaprenol N-acetylglucosamine transferase [Phycisphaerales bacterium]